MNREEVTGPYLASHQLYVTKIGSFLSTRKTNKPWTKQGGQHWVLRLSKQHIENILHICGFNNKISLLVDHHNGLVSGWQKLKALSKKWVTGLNSQKGWGKNPGNTRPGHMRLGMCHHCRQEGHLVQEYPSWVTLGVDQDKGHSESETTEGSACPLDANCNTE